MAPHPRAQGPDPAEAGGAAVLQSGAAERAPRFSAGPEQLTLVERVLDRVPLPYGWAALLVAGVLGPPGSLLVAYLESGSLAAGLEGYFYGYMPARPWQQILSVVLWTVFYAMLFWTIRRGRRSVLKAQAALTPLLPEDEADRASFAGLSSFLPSFLVGLAIELLMAIDYHSRIVAAPGPVSRVYEALSGPPLYIMAGTAVWVYARAVWGLDRVGRGPLRLKPFYEDKSMGLRPLAALSLSLSGTYFGLLLIMVLMLLIGPVLPQYAVVVAGLMLLGLALFFVPLLSTHQRMKREKRTLQASLKARWRNILAATLPGPEGPGAVNYGAAGPTADDLSTVLTLEALERKVAAVHTWPFDVPILGRLGVMALSILVALVTQIVKNVLGL